MRIREVSDEEFKKIFPREKLPITKSQYFIANISGLKDVGLTKDIRSGVMKTVGVDSKSRKISNEDELELLMALSDKTINRGADSEEDRGPSIVDLIDDHEKELRRLDLGFTLYRVFIVVSMLSVVSLIYYYIAHMKG